MYTQYVPNSSKQSYTNIVTGQHTNMRTQSSTQNNEIQANNGNDITLSQFLNKFETMFNQLMNQNSMMLNLLTTLINKSQ